MTKQSKYTKEKLGKPINWERVGQRLRALRTSAGFTQQQVSTYLGITQSQLSKIETGTRHMKLTLLLKLCTLYNIEDWDLLKEDEFDTTYHGIRQQDICHITKE